MRTFGESCSLRSFNGATQRVTLLTLQVVSCAKSARTKTVVAARRIQRSERRVPREFA